MASPITAFEGTNTVPELLKRRYGDVQKTMPIKFDLYKWLMTSKKFKQDGLHFEFPVVSGAGGGFTGIAEGGKFPGAVPPNIGTAKLNIVTTATLVAFSNLNMMQGNTDASGYLRNTDQIVKLAIENYKRRTNIALYGLHKLALVGGAVPGTLIGLNGVVNRISAVAGGPPVTSITVNRPLGYADADLGSTKFARYLMPGDVYAYGTIAGTTFTVKGHLKVGNINRSTSVAAVTVLSSTGGQPAAADWLVWADVDAASNNGFGRMPQGLGAILYQEDDVATGVAQLFENLPITVNDAQSWSSQVLQSAGPFDLTDWHQNLRNIAIQSGSAKACLVNDPTMTDTYAGAVVPDQRLVAQSADGGFKAPSFASGRPVDMIYDMHCPYGISFMLSKEEIFWLTTAMAEPGWDGTGWTSFQGQDSVYRAFKWYYNVGMERLNSHGAVTRIQIANAPG